MGKDKYYVKVGTGEIHKDPTEAEWEYEIEATEEDIAKLQKLFDRINSVSEHSFWRSMTPSPYHLDEENDMYDEALSSIYQTIYDLGDDNVKEQVESMGILK